MSNVFSLKRFSLLARSHFRKNLKAYVISCLVFAGVTIGLFVLIISSRRMEAVDAGTQFSVYFTVIYGGLLIFSAGAFQPFQQPREKTFQLMLPASAFEKFLLAWTVSLVGYTICANGLFFSVRYGVLQYYAAKGYEISGFWEYDRLFYSKDGASVATMLATAYFFIHAFSMLNSLMFKKLSVLKTALLLLLTIITYWVFNRILFRALFQLDITQAPLLPFMPLHVTDGATAYVVAFPSWSYWLLALSTVCVGLLWFAAYHKLREKEV